MKLQELYDNHKIKKNKIAGGKRILLICPSREYDYSVFINEFLIDGMLYEITYPKNKDESIAYEILMAEVAESASELVLQLECSLSKKITTWYKDKNNPELNAKIEKIRGDVFVNLHHHDEYSIRDGLGSIKDMALLLQSRDQTVCAITNHGSVGGWIKQYNICKKNGIKSIFGCLIPGQPIITRRGIKRIEEVCVGDEILTHKGRFRKVLVRSERNYSGMIYSPECWGLDDCWTTNEHPFLMYNLSDSDMNKKVSSGPGFCGYSWNYKFNWIRADKIQTRKIVRGGKNNKSPVKGRWSHYAVVPRCSFDVLEEIDVVSVLGSGYKNEFGCVSRVKKHSKDTTIERIIIPSTIKLDNDWMRFFGLFISEGSTNHGIVRWTFNLFNDVSSIEFLREFLDKKFGLKLAFAGYSEHNGLVSKAADFYVCNVVLQKLMDVLFGHGAKNKKFPVEWLGINKDLLWSLLDGIWEGDAIKSSDSLKTSSWELAQLCRQAVVNVCGNSYSITVVHSDDKVGYQVPWRRDKKSCYTDFDDKNSYLPVRSVKSRFYSGKVYNFEVEEDNSYVSGVAVHNCEVYVNDYRGEDPEERKKFRKNNHLCLWARNETGFYNIIKLHNDAQVHGFYYSPRCDYAHIKQWGEGIIASSACYSGDIPAALEEGNVEKAKQLYEFYKSAFDAFYIELTMIEWPQQVEMNKKLIQFAQEVGAPLIVTLDSHYLYPEYANTHDILLLIRKGKTVNDKIDNPEEVWQFDVRNLYYRDEAQLRQLWTEKYKSEVFTEEVLNEAIKNTRRIAMNCENIKLDSKVRLPKLYPDANEELRKKARLGLRKKGLDGVVGYDERLEFELDVIIKMGYADYFLVVEKIVADTKEKFGDMSVGWGRGCFTPEVRSIMSNGFPKFIDDIKVGDEIIADDKSIQTVEETFEYDVDEELFEIVTEDGRRFRCTKDHGIFVNINGKKIEKRAEDLQEGDDIIDVV